MVMDNGIIAEFDTPGNLLQNRGGLFFALVFVCSFIFFFCPLFCLSFDLRFMINEEKLDSISKGTNLLQNRGGLFFALAKEASIV
jgi:hypothetical protein